MRYRKYYPTVSEAFDCSQPTPGGTIDYGSMFFLFKNNHLFDGTLTYIDEDGETQHYPAVGAINNSGNNTFTPANLLSYFTRKYDERRLGFPAKGITPFSSEAEKEEAIRDTITKFNLYVESFTATVEYKYLELLKTTADAYNPLTGLKETEEISKTISTETFRHTHESNQDAGRVATLNTPHASGISISGFEIEEDATSKNTTTLQHGETVTHTYNNVKDEQVLSKETAHYTTTYDDSSNTRLESRDVEGNNGNTKPSNTRTGNETDGHTGTDTTQERLTKSGEEVVSLSESYTDTKTKAAPDKETRTKVSLDTERIKAARELALLNIVDMYFKELEDQVLLAVWS